MRTIGVYTCLVIAALATIGMVGVAIAAIRDPNETWQSFWSGRGGW